MYPRRPEVSDPLELELELTVVVSHQTGVLGAEIQASTRVVQWVLGATSPAPDVETSVLLRSFWIPLIPLRIAMAPRSTASQGHIGGQNSLP